MTRYEFGQMVAKGRRKRKRIRVRRRRQEVKNDENMLFEVKKKGPKI